MLPFFTNPYPNELLYSAIARYHFYSGNLDCKDTLEELFGSRCVIPSVEIGYFSVLAEKLGSHYSVESLLSNHTIYPYYASFYRKHGKEEVLQDVLQDGQALYTRLGMIAGSVCKRMVYIIVPNVLKQMMHNTENRTFIESISFKELIIYIMKCLCVNIQLQQIVGYNMSDLN